MNLPPRNELVSLFARNRVPVLASLPHDMATIAAKCGFAVLLKLVAARGGQRMMISGAKGRGRKPTALAAVVGATAARVIGDEFLYYRLNIMSEGSLLNLYRRIRGAELAKKGVSAPAIARELGITYRGAGRYKARARAVAA